MPLYEYQCSQCDQEFEKMMRFSDANQNPPCPVCQSQDTRKKISSFASPGGSSSGSSSGSGVSTGSSCGSRGGFS